jgi:predicted acyl esterase
MEARADVLTFTTAPLTSEFAITGHMYATLYVSSNATDTDFTAKARRVPCAEGVSVHLLDHRCVYQRHVAADSGRHRAHALVG